VKFHKYYTTQLISKMIARIAFLDWRDGISCPNEVRSVHSADRLSRFHIGQIGSKELRI
jgi:hypothetical protein